MSRTQEATRYRRWRLTVLALAVLTLAVASLGVGAVYVTPAEVWSAIISPTGDTTSVVIWRLRFPRILGGLLAGAALGASGAAYQGMFRNPLADPFVIGTAGGAAAGATTAILLGPTWTIPLGAFLGAFLATVLVWSVANLVGRLSVETMLLAGVALSSFLSSAVWLALTLNDRQTSRVLAWLLGSLSGLSWEMVAGLAVYVGLGIAGLLLASRALDALASGEEVAAGLGLSVRWASLWVVLMASLATGAAVAAVGVVGFIGLLGPHFARRLVGARHGWQIPAAALIGGGLLTLADTAARTLAAPAELPVGVVTSLVGAPFFLLILSRRGS